MNLTPKQIAEIPIPSIFLPDPPKVEKFLVDGKEQEGEVYSTWRKLPGLFAVKLKGFDYSKTNFFYHFLPKLSKI